MTRPAQVWPSRDLLWLVVKRDLKSRNRRTALGVIWVLLGPLLATTVIVLTLSGALAGTFGSLGQYSVYTLSGVAFVQFTSTALTGVSNSLTGNRGIITKVRVPVILFPEATLISAVLTWCAVSSYVVIISWLVDDSLPNPYLIVAICAFAAFLAGIGMFLSSLNARYEDVGALLPVALQALVFMTPIFYASSIWSPQAAQILQWNPMYWFVSLYRFGLGLGPNLSWQMWVGVTVSTALALAGGYWRLTKSWQRDICFL